MNPIRKNKIKKLIFDIWNVFVFMCHLTITLFLVITCLTFWGFMVFFIAYIGGDTIAISNSVLIMGRIVIFALMIVLFNKVINNFIKLR